MELIVILWLVVSIVALGGFAWSILYIFDSLSSTGFTEWKHWYKYFFTTPLLALVLWALRNYSFERKLLEKYAFKAVVSTSLTSYIKLLSDNFPNNSDKVLEFTMSALGKIYDKPYQEQDVRTRGYISLWNSVKAEIELDEKVKEKISKKIEKKIEPTESKTS